MPQSCYLTEGSLVSHYHPFGSGGMPPVPTTILNSASICNRSSNKMSLLKLPILIVNLYSYDVVCPKYNVISDTNIDLYIYIPLQLLRGLFLSTLYFRANATFFENPKFTLIHIKVQIQLHFFYLFLIILKLLNDHFSNYIQSHIWRTISNSAFSSAVGKF